jgi:hypothetical protein
MSKPPEQFAYFTITDSFDPNEITIRLGISPTESWQKGDLHPTRRLERKFSRWSLHSRLVSHQSLEEHIADVLDQMEQNPEVFKAVASQYEGCMQLVGYFHEGYPGIHFETQLLQRLAAFFLSVDFDFYELWSDGREDT